MKEEIKQVIKGWYYYDKAFGWAEDEDDFVDSLATRLDKAIGIDREELGEIIYNSVGMKSGDVYCTKNEVPVICKPERRKDRQSWFPKWWCYNCKRYVLPDNDYHKLCVTRRKA